VRDHKKELRRIRFAPGRNARNRDKNQHDLVPVGEHIVFAVHPGRRYFAPIGVLTPSLHPAGLMEGMMVIILTLSAGVLFILRMAPLQNAPWLRSLARGVVVGLSLCWATCFYVLITSEDIRIIFPFAALLLFASLISLYFDPRVLLSFIIPVWVTILVTTLFHPLSSPS
jgi:hypothetical protein